MNSTGPYVWVQAPRAYAIALMNAVAARDTAVGQETPIVPTATGADAGAATGEIGPLAHPMRMLGQNNIVYTLGIVAAFLPMADGHRHDRGLVESQPLSRERQPRRTGSTG